MNAFCPHCGDNNTEFQEMTEQDDGHPAEVWFCNWCETNFEIVEWYDEED